MDWAIDKYHNGLGTVVANTRPTTNELIEWHRETFEGVDSQQSIRRRLTDLQRVGFLQTDSDTWQLEENSTTQTTATLPEIMCEQNCGLRSLVYALTTGPMTLAEINHQQLDTHPELEHQSQHHVPN